MARFAVCALLLNVVVVGWALYDGAANGNPKRHFEETGFITWVSYLQLLATGGLSLGAYWVRRQSAERFWSDVVVWLLAGLGFIVLAADEKHRFHEKLDNALHDALKLTETGWSDRIDDLIIVSYGLIGIAVLWRCRREVLLFRPALPFIYAGFAGLALMVLLDVVSNRADLMRALGAGAGAEDWMVWLGAIEDAFKLMAEALFLVGFFAIFSMGRRMAKATD